MRKFFISLFSSLFLFPLLFSSGCSSTAKTSFLIRDMENPPQIIQETFRIKGKSDFILTDDAGYPFRLVYLCENRVFNFAEEPAKNFLLVSIQPILETPVEQRLSPDDRRRIWACMERKVWEEQSRVEEQKRRVIDERGRLESERQLLQAQYARLLTEIQEKQKAEEERRQKIEAENRRLEEERQRKAEEEQRKRAEEDRKIKYYRTGEREKEDPGISLPPIKITETGIFLVMKEAGVHEEPRLDSKTVGQGKKYDLFDVLNSKRDGRGNLWHQVMLKDRIVFIRGKKSGWTPEERAFWVKNKLLAWVYPGENGKINTAKSIKINVDDLQFTGRKFVSADKNILYEVTYEINLEIPERILGWIEEKNGIRRSDKTAEEMRNLLKDLAYTLWPISIQTDILRGQIREGFTPEQVTLAWGKPDHINKRGILAGLHEQWVYGENPFPHTYVYFENGEVKSWEFLKSGPK